MGHLSAREYHELLGLKPLDEEDTPSLDRALTLQHLLACPRCRRQNGPGHHSTRRALKDKERIEGGMRKAIQLWRTSEYWKDRAAGAIRPRGAFDLRNMTPSSVRCFTFPPSLQSRYSLIVAYRPLREQVMRRRVPY